MKILLTCFTYAPQKNGVQFVTQYLCEGLVRQCHSVTVLTHAHSGLLTHDEINGVEVMRWPIRTYHMRHIGPRKEFIAWVIEHQNEFDAMINVCTQSAMTDWLLPRLSDIHIPKLLHIHSIWDFELHPWDYSTPGALARKLAGNGRWGAYYFANSRRFRHYDRIFQLYKQDYSVDCFRRWYGIESEILENAAEDAFHEGAPVSAQNRRDSVVCVANFTRQKNQSALVEAFLRADLPDGWVLDLVGSRETPELVRIRGLEKALREQLGIAPEERPVNYHVGISREETVSIVKTASLYAMSSQREAFPVSLVEAMSAGVPWVSTDVGIARHLPGGVVVPGAEGLAAEIGRLCNDGDERGRLGGEGFDYAAAHFRIQDKVDQLERALLEVTGEKR